MAVFRNHDIINELISQEISLRKKHGMTQAVLAMKMGTTQSNIARFESGNYNPTLKFLNKTAKALGVTLHTTFE